MTSKEQEAFDFVVARNRVLASAVIEIRAQLKKIDESICVVLFPKLEYSDQEKTSLSVRSPDK